MKLNPSSLFHVSEEVTRALRLRLPVVALESTVITHGLPFPDNLTLARDMESDVRECGATPATIALVDGSIMVGVLPGQLERLAREEGMHKISVRDFAPAIAKGWCGGTTVAGTLMAAKKVGIQVFATGGIGGVHRSIDKSHSQPNDISADLPMLAKTPMIVVCAGAKAILDLPATLEFLETFGIPVVGYQTDDFPAFYSRSSGLKASLRADSLAEIVTLGNAHWSLGLESAILVVNPPPEEIALQFETVERAIQQALEEAETLGVRGQQVTPFLLSRVSELTGGASLKANLGLLRNNACLAARIAVELTKGGAA
jgi:pseudouridine-5'-phosphate glycosidase